MQSSQNDTESKSAQIAALGAALDAAISTPIPIDGTSIDEAKLKLNQVQASVDAIKASLTLLKNETPAEVAEKSHNDNGDAVGETPFDTNTAKRKRNRNRKRNKGAGGKEATPTSDSNDEGKSKLSLEQQSKVETAIEESTISGAKPSIQAEKMTEETDQIEVIQPDERKINDSKLVESKKEEFLVSIEQSKEQTKSVEGLKKADVEETPPVEANTIQAPATVSSSGNDAKLLEKTDKEAEANANISNGRTNKPVESVNLEEKAENKSETQQINDKKKDKGEKNKASEKKKVEPLVTEATKRTEVVAQSVQLEPAPPKSPPKQPTSTTDSKKQQQKKVTKTQQPIQAQKEDKGKAAKLAESASPTVESKQDALLPVRVEEKQSEAEVKVDKEKSSIQQVECEPPNRIVEQEPKTENVQNEASKTSGEINGKQPSPMESKRKKNARNGKHEEKDAQVAINVEIEQPAKTEPATSESTNSESAKPEAVKAELAKSESKKPDSAKSEPTKVELAKPELVKAEPAKVETAKPETAKIEPAESEPVAGNSSPGETKNQAIEDRANSLKQIGNVPGIEVDQIAESKPTESKLELPERLNDTPPTTPTVTPKETRKAISVNEDDTSRIWKILEEASKSLEPVEIEMDEGPSLVEEKSVQPAHVALTTTVPVVKEITADCRNVEILNLVLLEKSAVKEAPESQLKKTVDAAPVLPSESDKSRTAAAPNTAKTVETQPRKSTEAKKKPQKPQGKNEKSPKSHKPSAERTDLPTEKQPSICNESSAADVEIPLDMSIISSASAEDALSNVQSPLDDANQLKESVTDSKNAQGSDFVPSVEQSSDGAKSLVATVAAPIEQDNAKVAIENKPVPVDIIEPPADEKTRQKESNAKSKQTEAKSKTQNADVKPKIASKPKNLSPPKTVPANGSQKPSAEKKPSFPPKPDHLVSSKNKSKSPTVITKTPPAAQTSLKQLILDDDDEEVDYIEYKFMPRQVFICSICQACKASLQSNARVLCPLCQMITYCSTEHMQIDTAAHKELCTAIQEIAKKRGGHIYNNARVVNSNDYRSLRVHTLNICENLLKRPLQTFEREILLFPRLCSTSNCREWRQNQLTDCPSCHQVAYCTAYPEHLIENHQRWCKSFQLYEKLVVKQSVSGRIEPMLPTKIINKPYEMPNNIDDIFKDLYENYAGKLLVTFFFMEFGS